MMLVTKNEEYEKLLDNPDWVGELKRTGDLIRIHCYNGKDLSFYDKYGEIYSKIIPKEIIDTIRDKFEYPYFDNFIVDGILTYIDYNGKDVDENHPEAEPILWLFDIIKLDNEDLSNLKWLERKIELKSLCDIYGFTYEADSPIRYLPHYPQTKDFNNKRQLLEVVKNMGMSGIVLKNIEGLYKDDKSKDIVEVNDRFFAN